MKKSLPETALCFLLTIGLTACNGEVGNSSATAQSRALEPPSNDHFADSPWPVFHRNAYSQASTPLRGPEPKDELEVQFIAVTSEKLTDPPVAFATTPWLPLTSRYPDGCRAALGSGLNTVTKTLVCGDRFELVDQVSFHTLNPNNPLEYLPPITYGSRWANFLLSGNRFVVPDPDQGLIWVFADEDPTDPRSELKVLHRFEAPSATPGGPRVPTVTYDGKLLYTTEKGWVGVVDSETFEFIKAIKLPVGDSQFNNFPVDEKGGIYIGTGAGMNKLRWTGDDIVAEWSVEYDSRSLTLNGFRGSGTTPTLLGGPEDDDKLIVIVDAKAPVSNLVAYWREDIPEDWEGLPGMDRRIAAVHPLPQINPRRTGWAVENSPPARGYELVTAQSNGFLWEATACLPGNGVHKVRWDPDSNRFVDEWARDDINMNSVMTYSEGSNLVYGVGKEGCQIVFYGLDWQTGEIALRHVLGGKEFFDGGDNLIINDDRSVLYSPTGNSLVRIRPTQDNDPGEDRRWLDR